MSIGYLATLSRVYILGRAMHPGVSKGSINNQCKLMLKTMLNLKDIRNWYNISDNPLLSLALQRFPLTSGAIYWPYMNFEWPFQRRLKAVDQHYRLINGGCAIIAYATLDEVELAKLDQEYAGLRLLLDKASWFLREGEIVLNLFVKDQRIYSVAFTIGIYENQPVLFVGAIQGSNVEVAMEMYRDITHALHGMRPRDFLMVALKFLCLEFGISRILAISSEKRQHNSPYFGNTQKEKVMVVYNEIWLEHGGISLDNGFYEIPAIVRHKDMSEIPSKKRASYRRRYEMLDQLVQDIKLKCEHYEQIFKSGFQKNGDLMSLSNRMS